LPTKGQAVKLKAIRSHVKKGYPSEQDEALEILDAFEEALELLEEADSTSFPMPGKRRIKAFLAKHKGKP